MKMSHKVIIAVIISGLLLTGCGSATATQPQVEYKYAVIELGSTYIYLRDITSIGYANNTVRIVSSQGTYETDTKNVILSDMRLEGFGR